MKNAIRKPAVPSAWRAALLVLWCLWFYVLLVTPFAVMSVETPPFLTPAYAYLAVGMAMGVACAHWVEWRVPYRPSRRIVRCLIALSALVTLALAVPEWYSFLVGSVLGVDPYSSTWLDIPVFGSALKFMSSLDDGYAFLYEFVLTVDGIFCAFAGSRLFSGEENASVPDRRKSRDYELHWGLFFLWAVLSLMFLLGVLRPGFWSTYAAASESSSVGSVWRPNAAAFPCYVPTLIAYAVLVVIMALYGLAWSRRVDAKVRAPGLLSAEILAFATGEVTWNLISRCAQVSSVFDAARAPMAVAVGVIEIALIALSCTMLIAWKHGATGKGHVDSRGQKTRQSEDASSEKTALLEGLFAKWGLAPSESKVCRLMLEGKNSKESAEQLGLKAPTVRNYLQRSYKKAGVASSAELRELVEKEFEAVSSCKNASAEKTHARSSEADDAVPHPAHRILVTSLVSAFMASVSLYWFSACHCAGESSWAVTHSFTLGIGLGCTLVGVTVLADQLTSWKRPEKQVASRWRLALIGIAFALSGAVLLLVVWSSCQHLPLEDTGLLIGLCIASSLYAVFAVLLMHVFLLSPCSSSGLLSTFIVVSLELAFIWFSDQIWPLLEMADLLVFTCAGVIFFLKRSAFKASRNHGQPRQLSGSAVPGCFEMFLCFLVSFSMGLMLEELLRDTGAVFFEALQIAYFACMAALCIADMSRRHGIKARLLLWPAILMVAGALMGHALAALAFVSSAFLVAAFYRGRSSIRHVGASFCIFVAGIGLGLLLGRGITDSFYSCLLWNDYARSFLGDGEFLLTAGPAFITVLSASGLIACAFLLSVGSIPEHDHDSTGLDLSKRRMLYLASQGLSEQESMVVLKIVQGYTGFQIAYESHYSYGSVNTWRANAYRRLGVHSKRNLLELLEEQVN